jgi:glycosyltransferase involved in cell wall biosynthesis
MYMESSSVSLLVPGPIRGPENTTPSPLLRELCMASPRLPLHCKIASATAGLRDALASEFPELTCTSLDLGEPMQDCVHREGKGGRPNGVAYRNAARVVNASAADVVCLQYGSGIYEGQGGNHLMGFVSDLKKPLVTVFHTVEPDPTPAEQRVMEALFQSSARLVTMTQSGRDLLRECYEVPLRKIDVIPHGIPDRPASDRASCKEVTGLQGRRVLLTCGHLEPHKGIEHVIKGLPAVVRQHPDLVYVIMGATQPSILDADGESYRTHLQELVRECGVEDHVLFVNQFMDEGDLDIYIGAADLCITPYDVESRSCSANLARMVGMGRAVISTPYAHAREMLAEGRGRLVRFASPMAISSALLELLGDHEMASSISHRAWEYGRTMIWPTVARAYVDCFQSAVDHHREGFASSQWRNRASGTA